MNKVIFRNRETERIYNEMPDEDSLKKSIKRAIIKLENEFKIGDSAKKKSKIIKNASRK